jgi:hypothetical protein
MTDYTNTYPDLVNVEDWLNAKGYTGEAGACHQAMSLIRKQETRIAELEKMLAVHRLAVDVDALKARIAELTAALREFNFYLILDSDKDTDTLPVLIGHIRAARASYLGEKE